MHKGYFYYSNTLFTVVTTVLIKAVITVAIAIKGC